MTMKTKNRLSKLLFAALLMVAGPGCFTSCGNSIDDDTAIILLTYNEAIDAYKQEMNTLHLFSYNRAGINQLYGQAVWDKQFEAFKLDSLMGAFHDKHGEKVYRIMRLKVEDNFQNKMNR